MTKRHTPTQSPQVRERHENAVYINVPVDPEKLAPLLVPPAQPDIYNGSAWISICIDALFQIESPCFRGWIKFPGIQKKYMLKVNALIKAPLPTGGPPVPGYQIVFLSFEQSLGGRIMRLGALATQKIPTILMKPFISLGTSGTTGSRDYSIGKGEEYSAKLTNASDGTGILDIGGVVTQPVPEHAAFYKFVVDRGVKFLVQGEGSARKLVGAAWGEGYQCSTENVLGMHVKSLSLPILSVIGVPPNVAEMAIVFYQKVYAMIDYTNEPIPHIAVDSPTLNPHQNSR